MKNETDDAERTSLSKVPSLVESLVIVDSVDVLCRSDDPDTWSEMKSAISIDRARGTHLRKLTNENKSRGLVS